MAIPQWLIAASINSDEMLAQVAADGHARLYPPASKCGGLPAKKL
jgi:hypothetical protein